MILVTGGTGFVGQVLVRHLVSQGLPVRMLLRPSATSPDLPRGVPVEVAVCSIRDQRSLKAAMKDVDVVFHLAGSERSGHRADLMGLDVEGTEAVAVAAAQTGVNRFFYLSHLGADRFSAYPVLKAKALAEGHIIRSGVEYTIFRSAPIYGPKDQFTTSFARVLQMYPGIFLLPGDGGSLIQPIWVDDLVMSMVLALEDSSSANHVYEVGGAEYFSFRQVIETILAKIALRRTLVPISPAYLRIFALFAENYNRIFPLSLFWLDYLAADRTCALDTLPRVFGLMPARFNQQLDYLSTKSLKRSRSKT